MKEKKNIYKLAAGVVIIEIVMKIIAFVKQSVVAYYFGATDATDIYFVANDFMVSVSETIISAAKVGIMGIYATILIKEGKEQGNKLMSKFASFIFPIALILTMLIAVISPILAKLLAPSFSIEQCIELQKYILLLSGVLIFTSIIMIFETILNTNEVFFISRIRSLIYSLCVIIACFVAAQKGVKVLIAAQYASFLIYLIIQYMSAKKYFSFSLSNPFDNKHLKQILKVMIPAVIGNSIIRINYLVDKAVASGLEVGGISALAYCQTLDQFVVVILISSVSSVMFARFANLIAEKKEIEISETLNKTITTLCLILIPTTIITFIEAHNIVEFVYGHGNFDIKAVDLAALALQGYSLRYLFVGIRDIIIQALYAYKEVKKTTINALISTIVNILISVILVKKIGILAISLGTTISAFVGMVLNIITFKRINRNYKFKYIVKILKNSLIIVITCILSCLILIHKTNLNDFVELIIISILVFFVYYTGMYLLKTEEIRSIVLKLKNKTFSKFG